MRLYLLWDENLNDLNPPNKAEKVDKINILCDKLLIIGEAYREYYCDRDHFDLEINQWEDAKEAYNDIEEALNQFFKDLPMNVQKAIDKVEKAQGIMLTQAEKNKVAHDTEKLLLSKFKKKFSIEWALPGIIDYNNPEISLKRDPKKEKAYCISYANTQLFKIYGFVLSKTLPWVRLCTLIPIGKGHNLRDQIQFFIKRYFGIDQPTLVDRGETSKSGAKRGQR